MVSTSAGGPSWKNSGLAGRRVPTTGVAVSRSGRAVAVCRAGTGRHSRPPHRRRPFYSSRRSRLRDTGPNRAAARG
ncbi:unnamed protein product, partial [Ectocarpus sp. 12 AP-2014]